MTWRTLLTLIGMILVIGGCTQTTYSGYQTRDQANPVLSRNVQYKIFDRFYRNPPNCITVLYVRGSIGEDLKRLVEGSVARHLSGKVQRVIGPGERQILERRLVFDLDNEADRRRYSREVRCRHFARPEIKNADKTYVLVWTEKYLNLGLSVHTSEEPSLLWRSSHGVRRGEGGMPLSPISLGAALVSAGRAYNDQDIIPSMVDDSFRRMLIKFPDTRHF